MNGNTGYPHGPGCASVGWVTTFLSVGRERGSPWPPGRCADDAWRFAPELAERCDSLARGQTWSNTRWPVSQRKMSTSKIIFDTNS